MNDTANPTPVEELAFEYELDAPLDKVWRAISIPALRDQWLPETALAEPEPVSSQHNEEIRYRMRDNQPPFLESVVTFQLRATVSGGTLLRIIHTLGPAQAGRAPQAAANDEGPALMLAA